MPREAPSRKVAGLSAGVAAEPRRSEDRGAPRFGVSAAAAAEGQQQQHGHKSQEKKQQGTKEREGESFVALVCSSSQMLAACFAWLSSVQTNRHYPSSYVIIMCQRGDTRSPGTAGVMCISNSSFAAEGIMGSTLA